MKAKLFFVMFLFSVPIVYCFNSPSMRVQADNRQAANKTAAQLNDTSYYLRSLDPEAAVKFALAVRSPGTAGRNQFELARSFFNEGNALANQGLYMAALMQLDSALQLFTSIGNRLFTAKVLNSKGVVYGNLGDYQKAIEVHLNALKIREMINDEAGIPTSLNNLGIIYQQTGDFKQALAYYNRSLELHNKRSDVRNAIMTLSNIGALYSSVQDFRSALDYHKKALALCEPLEEMYTLSAIYSNIGADLFELGKWSEAVAYHKKSLIIKRQLGDQTGEAIALLNIGQYYAEQKKYNEAEKYLLQGRSIAVEIMAPEVEKNADFYLAGIFEAGGNTAKALFYYKQYSGLKDSLFNAEKAKDIGKVEERYAIEKAQEAQKQKERETQRIENERLSHRNRIQYTGIFIFIILLFFSAVMAGKFSFPVIMAKTLIFFTFLLFFEFTILLVDPLIESFSKNIPLLKLAINSAIALCISPLHGYLEGKLKHKLIMQGK